MCIFGLRSYCFFRKYPRKSGKNIEKYSVCTDESGSCRVLLNYIIRLETSIGFPMPPPVLLPQVVCNDIACVDIHIIMGDL